MAGDRDAARTARAVDYVQARKDYAAKRYAEAIGVQETFSMRPAPAPAPAPFANVVRSLRDAKPAGDQMRTHSHPSPPSPDRRNWNPRRTYPSPEENAGYAQGYEEGYNSGFSDAFSSAARVSYDQGLREGGRDGCQDARRRDYRHDRRRGHDEGFRRGYDEEYSISYRRAYQVAYDNEFRSASDEAYRNYYQSYYDRHYEAARSAAYAERVAALYNAAFNAAHKLKFNEKYPGYAKAEYANGLRDEEADFAARPLRLISVAPTETIKNGLFEPGEKIRLTVVVRNFSNNTLTGRDVKLQLKSLAGGAAVVSEGESSLLRDLKPKSQTTITDALEVTMTEAAVGRASALAFTLLNQGRSGGEQGVSINTRFAVEAQYAEIPKLSEGLVRPIRMRVTNVSQAPTDPVLRVQLWTNTKEVELTKPEFDIPGLAAGESRVLEFPAIAHTPANSANFKSVLSLWTPGSRRVGLLDQAQEVPVANDYRITTKTAVGTLRAGGIVRVEYQITNVSSRLTSKSLQVSARVLGPNAANFSIVGPNPQFLSPLDAGKTKGFVIPVLSKNGNGGGTLELQVQEAGVPVVIHRIDF